MNLKLNQVLGLVKGAKADGVSALTAAYHLLQKTALQSGISKTYKPRDDEGETLPPEGTLLQVRVEEVLDNLVKSQVRMIDLVATMDRANQDARADVIVDGNIILRDVPVTTLLTLEKQLVEYVTFVKKLPLLDSAEKWTYSDNSAAFETEPSEKTRTKKIPRNHVKAEATEKHAAQVEVYYEDTVVGNWVTVQYSGAIPVARQRELVANAAKLQAAIKVAREQANMTDAPDVNYGADLFAALGW